MARQSATSVAFYRTTVSLVMSSVVLSGLAGCASVLLSGCASWRPVALKSSVPDAPLRVSVIGVTELGEGVFKGNYPPLSPVAPVFLDGNRLLTATMGGAVEVVDLSSLKNRWQIPMHVGVAAKPLILGSSVVIAGMDAKIRRYRLATGELEWEAPLPAESPGGVSGGQGVLFVTAGDDSLSAIDEKTGRGLWNYKRPARGGNMLWSLSGTAVPSLSPDGTVVYAGFSDGAFVALEASSGKTVWERNFDRAGRFKDADTPPLLSPDGAVLYLSIVDGDFVALRARDGTTLWSVPGAAATAPFIDFEEKAFYLSARDNRLVKYSLEDTHQLWAFDLGKRGVGSQPVALGKEAVAITSTRAGLVVVDRKTGKLIFEETFAIGSLSTPAFDGKRMAVLSGRNRLHLYSVEKRI